ncbi:DUF4219 domain-containing protein [Cephalotus follicularis]|uniref:DUF4219 domain-containing protein n=1 Tax=Cephalotus follicularis TaxID=3775 RepID=A0A1Q3D4Y4_CEPFO|nr:DUF4219 domain-containing protein [Cephalotus follicularis]
MTSSTSANAIPVFSGENFDFWSIKIKTILRAYDLWEVVENGISKAAAPLKEKTEAVESTTTTTTKSESSPTTVPMKEWQKKRCRRTRQNSSSCVGFHFSENHEFYIGKRSMGHVARRVQRHR